MYVCICNAVTEGEVKACVAQGASSLDELTFQLGIGSGCGRCRDCAEQVIHEARADGVSSKQLNVLTG